MALTRGESLRRPLFSYSQGLKDPARGDMRREDGIEARRAFKQPLGSPGAFTLFPLSETKGSSNMLLHVFPLLLTAEALLVTAAPPQIGRPDLPPFSR